MIPLTHISQGSRTAIHQEMERLAGIQLKETLTILADGLPIYDLNFVGFENPKVVMRGEDICHFVNAEVEEIYE